MQTSEEKEKTLIKPDLICPEIIIHNQELPEYEFKDLKFSKPLIIVPWGSLYQAEQLDTLNWDYGKYYATISRCTHLDKWPITQKMIDLGLKVVFNSNVPPVNVPFKHIPWTDYARVPYINLEKDIDFSFMGSDCCLLRNKIFKLFSDKFSVIKRTEHFDCLDRQKEFLMQYQNILSRSRFSLCPKGLGSSSMELWESLGAGAIPILIADSHQMPTNWDWDNTIIRLEESKVLCEPKAIERAIWRVTSKRERLLRGNCFKAFEFFKDKSNLYQYIENNL